MGQETPFHLFQSKQKTDNPSASSAPESSSRRPRPAISDEEIQSMLVKMRKIHDEIESSLEKTYQKAGFDPQFIRSFVTNPDNFNAAEWKRIQSERHAFLDSIWSSLAGNIHSADELQEQYQKKALDKTAKDRKGKLLGARRNWISMR